MIRSLDLQPDRPVLDPCKIGCPPVPVQCWSVHPDINGLFHFSCEPVGVTGQNFDIVNADFVFGSIPVDVP